jgi:transcription initiation factor TFIID subunit 5
VDLVRWHPNCHYVATASSDRTVRLWDVATGECVRLMGGLRNSSPTSLAMSPDGRQVACGTDEGPIHVWDLGSARRVATLSGHVGPVWGLAYSHGSGAVLASGGADETVRLWSNAEASSLTSSEASGSVVVAAEGSAGAAAAGPAASAPYGLMNSYRTKSSPAVSVQFTARHLLLSSGAFSLRSTGLRQLAAQR